ncbi:MAG: DUF434 domain-containing protein [Thermoguttaceae bacterium]|nr:DUF434 domain-containing protein [Thermoguttaceae bacterium]MDW8079522.1 DUF434 domain-containing protein [Thermoguttaceae bacterium]
MPDSRSHRGPHPEDAELFAPSQWERLRQATFDLSWLLTRGYVNPSALALVGNRYRLTARQRLAVERAACGDRELRARLDRRVEPEVARGRPLLLDGYNVLTTVEAALGGGVLLLARDSTVRDMASMHGHYRKVAETLPAIELIGKALEDLGVTKTTWLLDRPVSNSGRLKSLIEQVAHTHHWDWEVELLNSPDPVLMDSPEIVATADSIVLDYCQRWLNLGRLVVERLVPGAKIIDLACPPEPFDHCFGGMASEDNIGGDSSAVPPP